MASKIAGAEQRTQQPQKAGPEYVITLQRLGSNGDNVTIERIVLPATQAEPAIPEDNTLPELPKLPELVTECQLAHFKSLGLGKGVNIADPKPWSNRSSFQVREISVKKKTDSDEKEYNITGSDEGSSYVAYESEVHSTFSTHYQMGSSFDFPNSPITVGIDAEQSRTVSTSRKTVGKRIIRRTIAFKAEEEVCDANPFQNCVIKWIIQRKYEKNQQEIETEWVKQKKEGGGGEGEGEGEGPERRGKVREESQLQAQSRAEVKEEILHSREEKFKSYPESEVNEHSEECKEFIHTFRITHYISAVQLGAAIYRSYTEKDYQASAKAMTQVTVPSAGGATASARVSKREHSRRSQQKTIGYLREDENGMAKVEMGSEDEAVVGIKMLPISTLITIPPLRTKIEEYTKKFFDESQDYSYGPFYIATNDDTLLLSVDKSNYRVYAVPNPVKSPNQKKGRVQAPNTTAAKLKPSLFHILPTDNPTHPHEFFITYVEEEESKEQKEEGTKIQGKEETEQKYQKMHHTPRYLTAPTNWCGYHGKPLQLKFNVRRANASFILVSRVMTVSHGVSTAPWISHRDTYFIRCITKRMTRHSYLATVRQADPTKKSQQGRSSLEEGTREDNPWELQCMPYKAKEDRKDVSMLFRLLPKYYIKEAEESKVAAQAEKVEKKTMTAEVREDKESEVADRAGKVENKTVTAEVKEDEESKVVAQAEKVEKKK